MLNNRLLTVKLAFLGFFIYTALYYTLFVDLGPAILFTTASLVVALIIILRIEDPVLRYIILFALLLRVILAFIQSYTAVNLPGAGVDSVTFENQGWINAQAWLYGNEPGRTIGAYYFSSWIGGLYLVFGRFPLLPQLANVYFSLITIYYLYATVLIADASRRTARIAALLLVIIPSLNAFSAILLRESIIIFFCILSFYFFVRWTKEGKLKNVAGSVIALSFAAALHGVMVILIWVYLVIFILFSPQEQRFRLVGKQIIPAVLIFLFIYLLIGTVITYQLPDSISKIITPDFIRQVIEGKKIDRTSYLQGILPYSYLDLFWQTPLRVIYFLFAPFPWALKIIRDVFGFFDVLLYSGLFYFAFRGAVKMWRDSKQVVLAALLIAMSLAIMFAWGTTNYGTAWRHRQKLAPYIIILAAAGLSCSSKAKWLFPDDNC